jgi:DNA replication protein DnaC
VRFARAADPVRQLLEARDQRELGRLTQRLQRADLLIVDELRFVPFYRQGGEVFHLRRSVLVTSNLAFSEWPLVFGGDKKLAGALLDRMAETATVITTRGKSFRMRRRANAGRAA